MEDITEEQVIEFIKENAPGSVDEGLQDFKKLQSEYNLSNYETVMLIMKMKGSKSGQQPQAGAEQPARLDGLRAKFGL